MKDGTDKTGLRSLNVAYNATPLHLEKCREMTARKRAKEAKTLKYIDRFRILGRSAIMIKFNGELDIDRSKRQTILEAFKVHHPEYVDTHPDRTYWCSNGELKITLRPPQREKDPASRKAARHDMPTICDQLLHELMTTGRIAPPQKD
jgi:hypothetical protein